MNPFPIILAALRRSWLTALLFICIIAATVALGIAISAQERALRQGSGTAADAFDLIVAAPGSQTDVLFSVVYLDPTAGGLLAPELLAALMAEERADFVAPIGFGDSYLGRQVVGTTAEFVDHLGGGLAEGRLFAARQEAVVGAAAGIPLGTTIDIAHGDAGEAGDADHAGEAHDHDHGDDHGHDHGHAHDDDHAEEALQPHQHLHDPVTVVGRMQPTGTPWDRAVIVPIEYTWHAHSLPLGHAPEEGERIGPPFAAQHLPGVPAVVVKPQNYAAAYDLRARWRGEGSTAFFPAEVLAELYGLLGDVARIMSALTLAAQLLVVAAILAGLLAVLDLQRQRFAVLRALGAPGRFIFLTVWLYVALLIWAGTLIGLPLGLLVAGGVSSLISAETGIAMTPRIGLAELRLIGLLLALSLILSLVPARLIYRRPVAEALR